MKKRQPIIVDATDIFHYDYQHNPVRIVVDSWDESDMAICQDVGIEMIYADGKGKRVQIWTTSMEDNYDC